MAKKPAEFCDYDCPFADFPPAETAGLCRTMAAVWCKKLKRLTHKNAPCQWTQHGASDESNRRGNKSGTGRKSPRSGS
ncbi:MAG: hypothetical protein JXA69_15740 [Phycisphaerae bacterium]|nr:hypothetical protein [Phycisphaerae bacterium]